MEHFLSGDIIVQKQFARRDLKKTRKMYFSLVELALGVAILTAGATAVVTLLPVGIKENKEAGGKNYIALTLQDIQTYITRNTEFSNAAFDDFIYVLPSSDPDSATAITDTEGMTNRSIHNEDDVDSNRQSGIYASDSSITHGVYAVKLYSGTHLNFEAQVNIWKSEPYGDGLGVSQGAGGLTMYYQTATGIEAEAQEIYATPELQDISGSIAGMSGAGSNNEFSMDYIENDSTKTMTISEMMAGTYYAKKMTIFLRTGEFSTGRTDLTVGGTGVTLENTIFHIDAGGGTDTDTIIIADDSSDTGKWVIGFAGQVYSNQHTGHSSSGFDGVEIPAATDSISGVKGINVELSWPLEKPYAKREKYKYYFEVCQPVN